MGLCVWNVNTRFRIVQIGGKIGRGVENGAKLALYRCVVGASYQLDKIYYVYI